MTENSNKKIKIMYISLTGIAEPLGESQVLEYLEGLSLSYEIFLYSFERKVDQPKLIDLSLRLKKSNIHWVHQFYSNQYRVFSAVSIYFLAFFRLLKCALVVRPDIFHCRSFFPAILGFCLGKIIKKKILFDIRGFSMEEKVDRGRLSRASFIFLILNQLENYIYQKSDYVITLTFKSRNILCDKFYTLKDKISVIPTCANRKVFFPASIDEKKSLRKKYNIRIDEKVLIHSGSTGGWYDFDSELNVFSNLYRAGVMDRFVILTRDNEGAIREKILEFHLPEDSFIVRMVDFFSVREWLALSDFAIFFIKPSHAKQASAPTKFAEMVATCLPVIANTGVGDLDYFLSDSDLGCLVSLEDIRSGSQKYIDKLIGFVKNFSLNPDKFNMVFNNFFSKEKGISRYSDVYRHLLR